MDFLPEWEQRFKIWMDELPRYFYKPVGKVELEAFVTREAITPDEASTRSFSPFPIGTSWGRMWEYGWFRGSITLPQGTAGQRVVLRLNMGGEALVWINGQAAGAKDYIHSEILLRKCASGGESFDILAESYAGHGPRLENGTPCPPGTVTIPVPEGDQVHVGVSDYGIWNEDAYQLWIDWQTLWQLRNNIDPKSLRWQKIDKALRDASIAVDFERETDEERNETFRKARECLAPALACHNGSTAPEMHMFGQSHLDLAWLWPWQETRRKSARTVSNQLALLEEYPSYRFLWCEPPLYLALKEHYPEIYSRVLKKMSEGRIFADGAVWVECDTNLPNGESLIRQIMYGRRFYQQELHTESRTVWLPDCFGFSAALPQIMAGCGVRYFATQKIIRNYNGGDPFPYNIFQWEGIDGTRILSHIFKKNNAVLDPETVITRWNSDRNQTEDIDTFLYPFGFGDGGGGPDRDYVEFMCRLGDLEGMPRMKISTLQEFFETIEKQGTKNCYVGELYFQCHRGTYTSQAAIKRGNRKCEFALRDADFWSAVSGTDARGQMEQLWKKVLFNQFHDVLPGASIHRVCQEAHRDHAEVVDACGKITEYAMHHLASGNALTVWNSLSWSRRDVITLPKPFTAAVDESGRKLPSQTVSGETIVEVEIPSCGYRSFTPVTEENFVADKEQPPDRFVLENEFMTITFDKSGRIVSAKDRETDCEMLSAPANEFRFYRDNPVRYEAWDIDHIYRDMPADVQMQTEMQWIAWGPLQQTIRVIKSFGHSRLSQDISLRRGKRVVEFCTTVDWNEHHKLLKVDFPTSIHANEALHEIQYGFIRRPTHRSRQYDRDRFEVVNHKYSALCEENRGVALLNDCKYGISAEENVLSLTLLRAPKIPDMTADMGVHRFTYGFTFWNGSFFQSDVVRNGYEMNTHLRITSGAGSRSLFQLSAPNVILDAVKAAEDGSGDLILRLYESKHTASDCRIGFYGTAEGAAELNMIEEFQRDIEIRDGFVESHFRPFEVKTIRLKAFKTRCIREEAENTGEGSAK